MRWPCLLPRFLLAFVLLASLDAQSADALRRPRIAFVSHAPDSDTWWIPIKNAIAQASEDFGADVDYLNPKDGSVSSMVAILGAIRPDRYDGVITTLADFQAERSTLAAIVTAHHLPLITVNSGTPEQSRQVGALVHIGQPEHASGYAAGQQAYKAGVRNFVCFNHDTGNAATHERCDGFGEGLGLPKASRTELPLTGSPEQIKAEVSAYMASHSPMPAILTLGPTAADPTVDVLRRTTKKGAPSPYFVTYDLSPAIVGGIKDRVIAFAIDQQPYAQGYLSVALMAEYLAEGRPENFKIAEYTVFAQQKMHARMSRYGIELKPSTTSELNSGPGFVTPLNVELVERYSGRYR